MVPPQHSQFHTSSSISMAKRGARTKAGSFLSDGLLFIGGVLVPLLTTAKSPSYPLGSLPPRSDPKLRNVQWVFLGYPGVGKGTYASRLSSLLAVPHIATGDLVREELSSNGPLSHQLAEIVNQGKLVSEEIIINLLSKRLEAGEAKGESGFILDGFPRTIRQAEILDEVTDIDLVVNLKLPESVLIEKCLGRRICSECGKNFNVASINVKSKVRMGILESAWLHFLLPHNVFQNSSLGLMILKL
ncbi:adenylate kinase [Camellia lanceoleosa]|uniref:Adenylate kinase n=1 Tax=Camellia lanceoleosa TaxID=1840588 RepID=A0ACC0HSQ7_9ERIC|nr:adenylate kinase [Camellia lanceoleosa]